MRTLDEIIKFEELTAADCETQASMCDLNDLYERDIAFQNNRYAERHKQIAELLKELKRLRELENVLDNIKEEIKTKIEQEDFARSVFLHEEKDKIKAEWCVGKIKAYNNVIKLIDRKKVRD